jgi:RNA polymerase sigma-54 factor
MISEEDKRNPLSDDKLVQILNEKGFEIARRTVAKYREMMDIPVARLRRGF